MKASIQRLVVMIVVIITLGSFSTLFFIAYDRMSFAEAVALTVSTLSTVGWADTAELSTPSLVLCTILSFGAITLVVGFIATFSQLFLMGSIQDFLGRRKMDDRIRQLKNHYIVCGFGMTGRQIAEDLGYEGKQFLVVDKDPVTIQMAREQGDLFIEGDATDEEVLKQAEISKAVGLFSVLDSDADNLLVVLSARGLNESLRIVSRVTSDDMRERFRRAGADNIVSYIDWASRNMLNAMLKPNTLQLLVQFLDSSVSDTHLEEWRIPEDSHLVGKSLMESGIREATGIHVLGYFHFEKARLQSNPPSNTILKGGDVIVGLGTRDGFKKLSEYTGVSV